VPTKLMTSILAGAALALTLTSTPTLAKECYAPDALAQQRAFSRAVITEGGKTVWLERSDRRLAGEEFTFEGQCARAFCRARQDIKAVGGAGCRHGHHDGIHHRRAVRQQLTDLRKEILKGVLPRQWH